MESANSSISARDSPANPNVHEIAQGVNPRARVVYADHDPIVASHGQARLSVSGTTMVRADVRSPDDLLGHEELRRLLDPAQPVAILLTLVLDYIEDLEDPVGIVHAAHGLGRAGQLSGPLPRHR